MKAQLRFVCLQAKADAKREYGSAVPRDGSLLHHLLRAHNKETGRPFSELEIMAQGNTFLLAGAASGPSLVFRRTSSMACACSDPAGMWYSCKGAISVHLCACAVT